MGGHGYIRPTCHSICRTGEYHGGLQARLRSGRAARRAGCAADTYCRCGILALFAVGSVHRDRLVAQRTRSLWLRMRWTWRRRQTDRVESISSRCSSCSAYYVQVRWGPIRTYDVLRSFDAGLSESIPTLEEVRFCTLSQNPSVAGRGRSSPRSPTPCSRACEGTFVRQRGPYDCPDRD